MWLVFGTGERMNLPFAGLTSTTRENNRLYTLIDSDPEEYGSVFTPMAESDLVVLPSNTGCADLSLYKGYFFRGAEAEKLDGQLDDKTKQRERHRRRGSEI